MKKTKKIVAPLNIGSLYKVKQYFWSLFPTKETAALCDASFALTYNLSFAASAADYWSRKYNCEVTYFSPDSIIVFLEEDGELKKVLTSEGRIGWIWFKEKYNNSFEEVKSE